ncbi:MAG: cupin domain-containing protein [Chloroflexi bacterium]|nr:cupin domain-containing protein [Chloroflexota bacterium]
MPFFDTSKLTPKTLAPGVNLRITWGERIMTNVVELAPGALVATHAHPAEQMGVVMEGSVTMVIGKERKTLGPGDVYLAPSNVEHSVQNGPAAARLVDIFSPPREDYK